MALSVRPSAPADVAAGGAIWHREEIAWFGEARQSAATMAHELEAMEALSNGVVVEDDGTVIGFAALSGDGDVAMGIEPDRTEVALPHLLPWLGEHVPHVDLPVEATGMLALMRAAGWHEVRTWLEMAGPVEGAPLSAAPPAGVELRDAGEVEAEAIHHLVYVDAAWGEVRGHTVRPFDSWQRLFLGRTDDVTVRVAAWRADRCVGWVNGVLEEDGTAFVRQLAVATDERGNGLGRALLARAFRELVAAGGTKLGLQVQDANAGALSLYRAVGLAVDRTWLVLAAPPPER